MSQRDTTQNRDDETHDASAFNRRLKYAAYACAVIELVALSILFYYKYYRRDT